MLLEALMEYVPAFQYYAKTSKSYCYSMERQYSVLHNKRSGTRNVKNTRVKRDVDDFDGKSFVLNNTNDSKAPESFPIGEHRIGLPDN